MWLLMMTRKYMEQELSDHMVHYRGTWQRRYVNLLDSMWQDNAGIYGYVPGYYSSLVGGRERQDMLDMFPSVKWDISVNNDIDIQNIAVLAAMHDMPTDQEKEGLNLFITQATNLKNVILVTGNGYCRISMAEANKACIRHPLTMVCQMRGAPLGGIIRNALTERRYNLESQDRRAVD